MYSLHCGRSDHRSGRPLRPRASGFGCGSRPARRRLPPPLTCPQRAPGVAACTRGGASLPWRARLDAGPAGLGQADRCNARAGGAVLATREAAVPRPMRPSRCSWHCRQVVASGIAARRAASISRPQTSHVPYSPRSRRSSASVSRLMRSARRWRCAKPMSRLSLACASSPSSRTLSETPLPGAIGPVCGDSPSAAALRTGS